MTYPLNTATQQFGSEKQYPFDYSHFNINGRVFGACGTSEDHRQLTVNSADLSCEIGDAKKIRLKAPIILPAMAKLDWPDYFSGAAMAGIIAVIGESAINKDPALAFDEHGMVRHAPILGEMIGCFRKFDRGYGDIVLQVNADDIALGTAEYALANFDLKTIEIKFGQAAKGIQHVAPIASYEEAVKLKKNGYLVFPDPLDEKVKAEFEEDNGLTFMQYGRLPMWDESSLAEIIARFRHLGAENIFFKMAGYDPEDVRRVLEIASENKVALVTFDGAGGGTGHSPCKMMNEWGYPTIELEKIVCRIMAELKDSGAWLPEVAIAGGFAAEDSIFKALALGAPYIRFVAVGRAAMAAAMSAKNIGEMIANGDIPAAYRAYGDSFETVFKDAKRLKAAYGDRASFVTPGSVGLYSYLDRLGWGLKLLMALNRKFSLSCIDRSDVIPLTGEAREY
jgi:hypothetical protein